MDAADQNGLAPGGLGGPERVQNGLAGLRDEPFRGRPEIPNVPFVRPAELEHPHPIRRGLLSHLAWGAWSIWFGYNVAFQWLQPIRTERWVDPACGNRWVLLGPVIFAGILGAFTLQRWAHHSRGWWGLLGRLVMIGVCALAVLANPRLRDLDDSLRLRVDQLPVLRPW